MNRTQIFLSAGLLLSGCATTQTPRSSAPVVLLGQQLTRQDDQLVGQRFRTLLDFEHDADAVFVRDGGAPTATTSAAHTGSRSLSVEGSSATINVDPLMYGAKLPADWTLLGGYVRVPGGGPIRSALVVDGHTLAESQRQTAADAWVFAAVDLTDPHLKTPLKNAKSICLSIQTQAGGFLLDDVLLVNNRKRLVEASVPEFSGWIVDRRGFAIDLHADHLFDLSIPSSASSPKGWALDEVNAIRARFSGGGANAIWTLYPDGRSITNGKITLLPGAPKALAESHLNPADVTVDDASGRLDRNTPGDADNDGYNEQRGAYQIVAHGSRLTLRIAPHGETPVASPVFEIKNLPGAKITAMVEGRLFQSAWRVDANTVLLVLPITIDRPIEVMVKASAN